MGIKSDTTVLGEILSAQNASVIRVHHKAVFVGAETYFRDKLSCVPKNAVVQKGITTHILGVVTSDCGYSHIYR